MPKPLIGIFGGTFDPVHFGHLNSVSELHAELNFDVVHWVLSARPPHKDSVSATIAQRFEMLEIALKPYPDFVADDTEISRDSVSYTIDTVEHFQHRYPDHQLCLIIGGDSLLRLHTWHRYQELIEMVHIVVMARPGYLIDSSNSELLTTTLPSLLSNKLTSSLKKLSESGQSSIAVFNKTAHDISSTKIRQMLSNMVSAEPEINPQELLPTGVFNYIHRQRIYRIPPMKPEQIKDHLVEALEDVKGRDIRVIDIQDISDFADYMVIASGTSDTHVKALARGASDTLRKLDVKPLNEDGADIGEWVLVDFGDVVLHVMRPEVREYYDLEKLWDEDVRELINKHREEQESK